MLDKITTALKQREDLINRLSNAMNGVPTWVQLYRLSSFISLDELERVVKLQEGGYPPTGDTDHVLFGNYALVMPVEGEILLVDRRNSNTGQFIVQGPFPEGTPEGVLYEILRTIYRQAKGLDK